MIKKRINVGLLGETAILNFEGSLVGAQLVTKINIKFEEEIYKKYYPLVFSTCRRFLVSRDTLEDAIQSVFLLYIKKEDRISSNLSSWFYWASVNICKVVNKETLKHAKNSLPILENAAPNDERQSQEEVFKELGFALDKLPSKKRDMLLMRFYENKSYREIGSYYKSSEDSVQKMVERTIHFLKNEIKNKEILNGAIFAQFFCLDSASPATQGANQFILQNSLLQQSFIKGVQKMYLITKLKIAIVCLCFTIPLAIPLSTYIFADNDKPIFDEGIQVVKPKIEKDKPMAASLNQELITPEVLAMTDSALKYLADRQSPNGSWSDTQYNKSTGVTALCCLAFMAEGSRPRVGKYGKNIEIGLDFLLQNVQKNGLIAAEGGDNTGPMYEHGLACMVLLISQKEAIWRPQIQKILENSVAFLTQCQKSDGGWGFDNTNTGKSNMVATTNVIWFLKLSEKFGYSVPAKIIKDSENFIVKCAYPDGKFRYIYFGIPSTNMNCLGIIALNKKGDLNHPLIVPSRNIYFQDFNRKTIDDMKAISNFHFDSLYASVAMYAIGGTYWNTWFPKEVQYLKAVQRNDGSVHDEFDNSIYSTAISAIILQSPNGKLPLYERGHWAELDGQSISENKEQVEIPKAK